MITKTFPAHLLGSMVWTGQEYRSKPELHTRCFSDDEVALIEKALHFFKGLCLPRTLVSKENFPLPDEFSAMLQDIHRELNEGRGFHVLHGLEPSRFSEEDLNIVFAGLASHVARSHSKNMDHIRYEKADDELGEELSPGELPVAMDLHTDTDSGNILCMLIVSKSASGGGQYLSSFWKVYNKLLEQDAELLAALAQPWHWEKPECLSLGRTKHVVSRPIIGHTDGKVQINFSRGFVAGHPKLPRSENAPPLSDLQLAALGALAKVAREHSLRLELSSGDILFINNLSIMHGREAFIDDETSRRHILRMWLRDAERSWSIAPALKYEIDGTFDAEPSKEWFPTLTEWKALPRAQRIASTTTTCMHD